MYTTSETVLPGRVLSIITKTLPLLYGRLENERLFSGTHSVGPIPFKVAEFMDK